MIFMKSKSITTILEILLFIVSLAGFIMLLIKMKLPKTMVSISTILLVTVSMSAFIRTRKLRKLAYPLFTIYFLLAIPIIANSIDNKILSFSFTGLSFVITIIFIYSELIISSKEKELPH